MQAIGRWGNFFNQELYGAADDLPWGIAIDCAHRVDDHGIAQYPCPAFPATTAFHPLFLYESLSGVLGAITLLWIARRYGRRMRPGDLLLIFFIWYAAVRFALETFRTGNWTFFGVPTAMLVSGRGDRGLAGPARDPAPARARRRATAGAIRPTGGRCDDEDWSTTRTTTRPTTSEADADDEEADGDDDSRRRPRTTPAIAAGLRPPDDAGEVPDAG